jgi:serine/threonine protein phosphatase PrpC
VEDSRLVIGAATDPGPVREQNEDSVYFSEQTPEAPDEPVLLLVADGMGGYQRGEVASRMAIDTMVEGLTGKIGDDIPLLLKQTIRQANEQIYEGGSAEGEHNMMGTTLVAGVVKGVDITIANVGDSRAYLIRANRLTQISQDHSLVAEQVAMGAMTEQEARDSHHKNIITRALGHRQKVDIDIFELKLLPDDRVLFSTDGLHDYVDEDELIGILTTESPDEASREIVSRAISGGSTDNVTALIAWLAPVSVLDAPAQPAVAERDLSRLLVPALVAIGVLIFIAIVAVALFAM